MTHLYRSGPDHKARVRYALSSCIGPDRARHIDEIARMAGVSPRLARDAYADLDGEAFVLAKNERGLYVAESREQAASFDAEIDAKLRTLWKRRRKRRAWFAQQRTPLRQLSLEGVA